MATTHTQYDYMDVIGRAKQEARAELGICNPPEGNSGEEPVRRYNAWKGHTILCVLCLAYMGVGT